MKNLRFLLYPSLLLFFTTPFLQACKNTKTAQSTVSGNYKAAFYNIENLFDTLDQVDKSDEEFTANGRKKWNTVRYFDKLSKLTVSKPVEW